MEVEKDYTSGNKTNTNNTIYNMFENKEISTSVVDGEVEDEHITRRQTGDGVRDSRENYHVKLAVIIMFCFSSFSGSWI